MIIRNGSAMIPIDQQDLHNPPSSIGDCHAACIASILEVPLETVPRMESLETKTWWQEIGKFLGDRGLFLIKISAQAEYWVTETMDYHAYYIACGKTARSNALHCVVMRGCEMAHDPHPSRTGLIDIDTIELMVPINPALTRLPSGVRMKTHLVQKRRLA